jgi:hypothetical protein
MADQYSHQHNDRGRRGESYVRRRDDLEASEVDWCDLRNPRTNSAHEVKVCEPNRRFRIWEDNHRSLTTADGQNAAWYHFLVVTDGGNVIEERRMKATTVTKLVRERGGWNESGHERGSRQLKIPESEIF